MLKNMNKKNKIKNKFKFKLIKRKKWRKNKIVTNVNAKNNRIECKLQYSAYYYLKLEDWINKVETT